MLATRRELIAKGLANSEKIKAELAKNEIQRQEVLARANVESARLIEEARAAAAQRREQEAQKASLRPNRSSGRRERIAQDHTRMLTELKRDVGSLVVETLRQISPARS